VRSISIAGVYTGSVPKCRNINWVPERSTDDRKNAMIVFALVNHATVANVVTNGFPSLWRRRGTGWEQTEMEKTIIMIPTHSYFVQDPAEWGSLLDLVDTRCAIFGSLSPRLSICTMSG
jgi:hypothetical protein